MPVTAPLGHGMALRALSPFKITNYQNIEANDLRLHDKILRSINADYGLGLQAQLATI